MEGWCGPFYNHNNNNRMVSDVRHAINIVDIGKTTYIYISAERQKARDSNSESRTAIDDVMSFETSFAKEKKD
jgi:hypothetical protein